MSNIQQLFRHFKQFGFEHKQLYSVSIMLFFFAVFDGIFSFITPILITQRGFSETMMGIIIGTSSIAGILFDLILCRILKNTKYRLIYLLMFLACFTYPLILWQANTLSLFIIAMALWGLYYDLLSLGNLDFVAKTLPKSEYSSGFGVMRILFNLGYLIAPIIGGYLAINFVDFNSFVTAWIFIVLAFVFYIVVILLSKNHYHESINERLKTFNFFTEIQLWKKIGRIIFPVLCITLILNLIDSFFWTIGPLISDNFNFLGIFSGLFMMVYTLPALFTGIFIGNLTRKLGKKRTAYYSLFIGSLFLSMFILFRSPLMIIVLCFFSSLFTDFAWPAISGAYADYVSESELVEKEISTLQDSFTNIGYIIGPVLAGFLSQNLGHIITFSLLGVVGMITAVILMIFTPKAINVKIKLPS
jgi:MFS family permease